MKKISIVPTFSLSPVFRHDLTDALILPVSQLQTQKVMTSLIMSHIEHLIQTSYIILLNL